MLISIIIAIIVIGLFLHFMGSKPIYHKGIKIDEFPKYLASLMVQYNDGGLLFFNHEGSEKFLQFAKYIRNGEESMNFGFPDTTWSRMFFHQVKEQLRSENVLYTITETGRDDTRAFLEVSRISSIEEGHRIAKIVLKATGLSSNDTFTVHFTGTVSTKLWKNNSAKYNKYFKRHLTRHSS